MQTFLPYADFKKSAQVLDYKRLGKQRVEAWQIYMGIEGKSKGWRNHPAVNMWRGCEYQLLKYGLAMCDEWVRRGYKDTMRLRFREALREEKRYSEEFHIIDTQKFPKWFGNTTFHVSHRSNLLRKLPKHYRKCWPKLRQDLPYKWPIK